VPTPADPLTTSAAAGRPSREDCVAWASRALANTEGCESGEVIFGHHSTRGFSAPRQRTKGPSVHELADLLALERTLRLERATTASFLQSDPSKKRHPHAKHVASYASLLQPLKDSSVHSPLDGRPAARGGRPVARAASADAFRSSSAAQVRLKFGALTHWG